MPDTAPAAAATEAEPTAPPLDFERAEYAEPSGEHLACAFCKREITTEYWQFQSKVLCAMCRGGLGQEIGRASCRERVSVLV